MSNILVYGSIFNGPRNFINKWAADEYAPFQQFAAFVSSMLSCMMCTSTWVGFFMSLVLFSPTKYCFDTNIIASTFFDGMLASGSVWAVNAIIEWFEKK
jgi:hypothetical protein